MIEGITINTGGRGNAHFGLPETVTREQVVAAVTALGLNSMTVASLGLKSDIVEVEILHRESGARITAIIPVEPS